MRSWSLSLLMAPCLIALITELPGADKPVGLNQRTPWTTSKVFGTPDPPSPYRLEPAFPNQKFNEPLAFATASGINDKLFIAERHGKIWAIPRDPKKGTRQEVLDLGRTIYGFAFHPRYPENGYLYVSNVLDPANPAPDGSRLSRFTVDKTTMVAGKGSETVILTWPSGGHNGGCVKFGPDGLLYLATGDGSGIADELQTGQKLDDLLGALLRIDVDHPEGDKPYGIPKDNPFVNTKGARPEIYAYGLRQLWKFSFDRKTNQMWGGEVGQDLWEMIYRIEKGGNYGWSRMEGSHPFRPERPQGPTPIIAPIIEHNHNDFRSITGGFVYRGGRLPELQGCYLYADYDTGRVWAFRYADGKVTEHRELADTVLRLVEWGEDQDGELFLVDFTGGQLHQLQKAPPLPTEQPTFPRKLSQTGLFASTKDHLPAPGVIPYSVNTELWSDGAVKDRFLAIPGDGRIGFDAIEYPQPAPGAPHGWRFPDNTVVVKTFSLELEAGNPQSRRRLETRILHFEQTPGTQEYGDQVWKGYTYVWNDEQTDAELLAAGGLDRDFTITDKSAPGGKRTQTWHFPSRAECTLCHTQAAKFVLGVNTLQMNRDHDYGSVTANQLRTFEHIGLFDKPLPKPPEDLERLPQATDASLPIAERARAYLHANCSHCHRKWGGGNAEFRLLYTLTDDETGTLNVKPGQGSFDLKDPRLIVPGDPSRSMIYHRMTRLGQGRMPHVASTVIHTDAVKLIGDWIKGLPAKSE
jgi:uncharacterized repeat protein (TIGR03806 family)